MLSSVSELGPCYSPIELPWNMGAGMRRDRAVEESERAERLRETDGRSLNAKREDSGQGRNVRRRGETGDGWRKEMVGNFVGGRLGNIKCTDTFLAGWSEAKRFPGALGKDSVG